MKKLNWFDRFLFVLNSLFATALLFSYLLPYIPPKKFALLSVLSLFLPLLIIINGAFLVYWLLKLKRQFLLPLIVLLLGFNHVTSVYEFSSLEDEEKTAGDIKVLSYNVRQFNQFGWTKETGIPEKISDFLIKEDPDILALQEYSKTQNLEFLHKFPSRYIKMKEANSEFGLAVFSKHPIVNTGSLDFPTSSNNNGIFADVLVKEDTLRIVSVHMQSFQVKPDMKRVEQKNSKKVFLGMGQTFVKQQDQTEIILKMIEESPHNVVLMGDFNNTAYSYIYRKLMAAGLNDAFKEGGSGFGRTFNFDYYPLRIDFILPDEAIEITSYGTVEVPFSDHFPIKARLKL